MWAYQYREKIELAHLERVDIADPIPGPGQVLLRMQAASMNFRDLAIASGHYHVGVEPPLVPVSDGAGTVVSCGPGARKFREGELVCPTYFPDWIDGPVTPHKAQRRLGGPSDGVLREYMCVDESALVRAPTGYTPAEAATLPVAALTAWHSLFAHGNLGPGMSVLIQGVGGVASFGILFCRLAGARSIVLVRSEAAREAAQDMGASDVILCQSPEDWPREVRRVCPAGVDRAMEIVGTTLTSTITCCRGEAMIHLVGYAGGTLTQLDIFAAIRHAIQLRSASAGSRESFERMVAALDRSELRPLIGQRFEKDGFAEALNALKAGGRQGKIVLDLES